MLFRSQRGDHHGDPGAEADGDAEEGVQLEGLGGSVDTQTIKAMLAEHLGPITAERQRAQQEREADTQAEQQYNDFISNPRYPNAQLHENEIATVMRNDPQISLAEAYLTLKTAALENGLDFTKPLAPQWMAKKNGQQSNTQNSVTPANQTGVQPRAPLPNGRSGGSVMVTNSRIAPSTANNSDIVREAMREFGFA